MDDFFDFSAIEDQQHSQGTGVQAQRVAAGGGGQTSSTRGTSREGSSSSGGYHTAISPNVSSNSAEVQRLLVENRKLRQENTLLKVQIEEYKKATTTSGTSRRQPPLTSSDAGQKASEHGMEDDVDVDDDDNRSTSSKKHKNGSEKGSSNQRTVAQLKGEIQRLQESNAKLNQAFADYTLVNTEREHAYASVYASVREQLDSVKEERDVLQAALEVERKKVMEMEKNMEKLRESPNGVISRSPIHPASSSPADAAEVVTEVLQTVGRELQHSLERAAIAALRRQANASGRGLSAAQRQAVLRRLPTLDVTTSRQRRRGTASKSALHTGNETETGNEEADRFFEEDGDDRDEKDAEIEETETAALMNESFAPDPTKGLGDAEMSSAFRQERLRNQALVASRTLNLPKGAGALRASTGIDSTVAGDKESVAGKKRTRSTTQPQGASGRKKGSAASAAGAAPQLKKSTRSTKSAGDGHSEQSGMSDTASATGSINPFEGVKMTTIVAGSSRRRPLIADDNVTAVTDGQSGGGGGGSFSLRSSVVTSASGVKAVGSVADYLQLATQVPPPTKMALAKVYNQLIQRYAHDFTRIAEEVKQYILKRCILSVADAATATTVRRDAASEPPTSGVSGPLPSLSSPFSHWTHDWQTISVATEGFIWRTLQKLFAGFPVDTLFTALQASFTSGVVSLLERCAEEQNEEVEADGCLLQREEGGGMGGLEVGGGEGHPHGESEPHRRRPHGTGSTAVPPSPIVVQLHTLATSLNFLWVQFLLHVYQDHKATRTEEPKQMAGEDEDLIECLETVPRLREVASEVRRRATQLLHDGSIAALRQWHLAAATTTSSSSSPSALENRERKTNVDVVAGGGEKDAESSCSFGMTGDYTPRATVLRLWMTMMQALVGRTSERRAMLELTECPVTAYEKVFLHNLVSPAPPKGGLAAWIASEAGRHMEASHHHNEDEETSPPRQHPHLPVAASTSDEASTHTGGTFGHALMVYMLKAIMANCLTNLAADHAASSAEEKDEKAVRRDEMTTTTGTTTTTTTAAAAGSTALRDVWFRVADAVGWSVGVRSVDDIAYVALARVVALDGTGSSSASPSTTGHADGVESNEEEEPSDEEGQEEEEDVSDMSDREQQSEEDEETTPQATKHLKKRSNRQQAPSSKILLPGMAHLLWEKQSSTPLLALRLAVLYKGFPYIATFIQPRVHGKPHEDDIMAHVLSSVVLDLRFVAASAGLDEKDGDEEGEDVESPPSPGAGVVLALQGSEASVTTATAATAATAGGPDVSRRVLKFLLEYVTGSSTRPPFPHAGTIHIMAIEGIVQLLSRSGPQDIQRHTTPLVEWMHQGARTVAMKAGLSVSEKVKPRLLTLLPKESNWQSTTGRDLLHTFLSDDI